MKKSLPEKIEKYRTRHPYGITQKGDMFGFFIIPYKNNRLHVMVGSDEGWDHVSVSLPNRCPTWNEMCYIKNIFFDLDELVIQYHPPEKDYINVGKTVLHMWKPWDNHVKLPPKIMV